ncbi:hypothetical protein [Tenuibacillus multivorans]|uniref:Uncharacterized protein n=1 Tax=Tenuibacillus multivorans TaxID=237069 RepID=A0A1G9X7J4_9BACI|nr:hypothetical protein [Tenuibacillus multivorans]GEL78668.1 hypothetical protein TMU01_29030 [Tenuibacillus multivorans]SDM92722.1 hypothetical protein SAMN05216498_1049 [Tenuibacillus multivorans]
MKLEELFSTLLQINRGNSVIETEEDWFIAKGIYLRRAPGNIVDAFLAFKDGKVKWKFVNKRINFLYEQEKGRGWTNHRDNRDIGDHKIIEAFLNGEKMY